MKRLSQSGSSNFCPELRKNALLISQSHFSNFAMHVIKIEIKNRVNFAKFTWTCYLCLSSPKSNPVVDLTKCMDAESNPGPDY